MTLRTPLIVLAVTAVLSLSACGSDSTSVAPAGTVDDASAGLTSALADVERIAVGPTTWRAPWPRWSRPAWR